jgi:pyrimidine deaminase RibD-like protein
MERALDVMRKSVPEPRADGKASPSVGVVLWKPDGMVETACKGELRGGDHAEYTLLQRKTRDSRRDGAVLFATLEPCAPGSRRHPKLGCAERIVLACIKESAHVLCASGADEWLPRYFGMPSGRRMPGGSRSRSVTTTRNSDCARAR